MNAIYLNIFRLLILSASFFSLLFGTAAAQIIDLEDFGTGAYPGAPLPAGQTTYIYNAPAQPANFPNILVDGEYVIATNSQQGFSNWASVTDNTTGTGYMMLVNADANQSGEFYRRTVSLTANTKFDFLASFVTVNSQADFDFCTNNQGGLVLPNVTLLIEDSAGQTLASLDTGDIPFDPSPQWETHELEFTTLATTTSIDVVLINNSLGGCGNDLAIDDVTFRVAVTMEAFDDSVTVTDTSSAQSAILVLGANDNLDGNSLPGTELYTVTPTSALPPGFALDTNTGELDIAAGVANGTYTFEYEVCETSNAFNCDIATVTITVADPSGSSSFCPAGTSALPGTYHVVSATNHPGQNQNAERAEGLPIDEGLTDTGANTAITYFGAITMDLTGDPNISVPEGEVMQVSLSSAWNTQGRAEILMSADGTSYTSLGTTGLNGSEYGAFSSNVMRYDEFTVPAGGARFLQVLKENQGIRADGVIYGTQCQTFTSPPVPITAVDDSGSVADSSTGFTPVLNVLDNDTIDGVSPPTDFVLAVSAASSLPSGLTFDTATGEVGVLQNTPTGIYVFDYDICELGNPSNCATATVTIDVTNPSGSTSFCPAGTSALPGTYHVVSATNHPGQNQNAERAEGLPIDEGLTDTGANTAITYFGAITMDLTGDPNISVPEGEVIKVSLSSAWNTQGRAEILMSADGTSYTSLGTTGLNGSEYGAFSSNVMRYDEFTVPAGGARFLQVLKENQGIRADGVIYTNQCQPGGSTGTPNISASKSIAAYDPNSAGLYSVPGNDVIYTITVDNTGTGDVDTDSLFLVDNMPAEIAFYNGDIDGASGPEVDPIAFSANSSGLTFAYPADVGFSNAAAAPTNFGACSYSPVSGYDEAVTYICFNPKGSMAAGSDWSVSFRARID